ncbi:MAG: hypothetical protein M3462_08995 [Chloroflexota bacterium]|nr:hypothetical protein [Chloroflexota bacterium]
MGDAMMTEPIRTGGDAPPAPPGDDRLEILRMVESGVVTADEAATLLDALQRSDRPGGQSRAEARETARPIETARRPKTLRIRVTEEGAKKPSVNIVLPLGLIDTGLQIAEQYLGDYVGDTSVLRDAVMQGVAGAVLDVQDEDQHVEIIVE